jgi:uncharacterized protein HemY
MEVAKHDKAVDLTEEALDKLADGDDKAADKLIQQAKKLDPNAPEEVLQDLDEDAIHQRAYRIWDDTGRPDGKHQEHWEQARREISGQ